MTGFKELSESVFARAQGTAQEDTQAVRRRRLVWRMGIAVFALVALLGTLFLFDHFNTPAADEEGDAPALDAGETSSGSATPEKPETTSGTAAAESPESMKKPESGDIKADALPDASKTPQDSSAQAAPSPETCKESPKNTSNNAPLVCPVCPVCPVASPPALTSARKNGPAASGRAPVLIPSLPAIPANRLQVGVFSDPRRAEGLHTRLTLEGVPATIETRVHVGPFKSQAEMKGAQTKLKALGIAAVVIPPLPPREPVSANRAPRPRKPH